LPLMKLHLASAFLVTLALAGCNDPAKDKPKAVTGEVTTATAGAAARGPGYAFDGTGSKIGFVGAKITGKHEGGFGTFKGSVNLVDNDPEKSSVTVDIETSSLTSDQEKLTGHLKSPEFFDVAKFPKATFASTAIKKGGEGGATHTITGNLTLHGVSKSISFPAKVQVAGDSVSVDADFAINRKDFGLVYPGKPDDLIKDDVLIKLAIKAKKG